MTASDYAKLIHLSANPVEDQPIDPRRRYLCRHVFTDGHRCGSPALRGQELCYYHERTRTVGPSAGRSHTFKMPRIDDRNDIQIALFDVLSRVAGGDIEYRRGSVLLYGLQIASSNLARRDQQEARHPVVEEITKDFDLGDLAPRVEIPDEDQPITEVETITEADPITPVTTAKRKKRHSSSAQSQRPASPSEAPCAPPDSGPMGRNQTSDQPLSAGTEGPHQTSDLPVRAWTGGAPLSPPNPIAHAASGIIPPANPFPHPTVFPPPSAQPALQT